MVYVIFVKALTKLGFINNYSVLLISNIILFSNVLKIILSIIFYGSQLKFRKNSLF